MGTMDVRKVEPNKEVTMLTKNLSEGMHVTWWLLLDNGKNIKNKLFAMHDMTRFLA
jgi:hypothetical protein